MAESWGWYWMSILGDSTTRAKGIDHANFAQNDQAAVSEKEQMVNYVNYLAVGSMICVPHPNLSSALPWHTI